MSHFNLYLWSHYLRNFRNKLNNSTCFYCVVPEDQSAINPHVEAEISFSPPAQQPADVYIEPVSNGDENRATNYHQLGARPKTFSTNQVVGGNNSTVKHQNRKRQRGDHTYSQVRSFEKTSGLDGNNKIAVRKHLGKSLVAIKSNKFITQEKSS